MIKKRYLEKDISQLCFGNKKMAFVSGPRQCGKTTMAKQLLNNRGNGKYFNWDEIKFRRLWAKDPSQITKGQADKSKIPLIVLDEIHKAKLWKRNLKGVYDTLDINCDILVTGSAKLNVYRKGSDSLLGRYYHFRLHPFSLAELLQNKQNISHTLLLKTLLTNEAIPISNRNHELLELFDRFGPFPEPLLSANQRKLNLWRRERVEKVVREDLRDLSRLPELSQIEMLIALLPERASNVLSIRSLSEDLEVAYTTIKRWLQYCYELYYAFKIQPYFKSLPQSLKKEAKLYLWDWSEIEDEAARFENLIASHLLKYCHYLTDTGEGDFQLNYLRNKQKKEIDFLIVKNKKPWLPIEVKLNNEKISENWPIFMKHLPCQCGLQVIKKEGVHRVHDTKLGKIIVISASHFLSCLI